MTGDDLRFVRKYPGTCCAEVSRKGESQPCDKTAVAIARSTADDGHCWPVCAFHARGTLVSLTDLIEALT